MKKENELRKGNHLISKKKSQYIIVLYVKELKLIDTGVKQKKKIGNR